MRSIRLGFFYLVTAFDDVLVIVQIAVISGNAEESTHVLSTNHLFGSHESLVEFLAVSCPNVLNSGLRTSELDDGLGQSLDGCRGGLLNKQITLFSVLESEKNKIDRVIQSHHKAGHVAVRDGDRAPSLNLFKEEWDDGTTRSHDVAITGQAQNGVARKQLSRAGDDVLLHEGLRDAHRVDRVGRLVGREEDRLLDVVSDAGGNNIVRAEDVGLGRLERVELAGRDLLERRGGEAIIDAFERVGDRSVVADVADVELQLVVVELLPHVILLLLITREDADLLNLGFEKSPHDRVAERAGAPGHHQYLTVEDIHMKKPLSCKLRELSHKERRKPNIH